MKKINLLASAALSLTLLFTACSVEKRHYTKGYNVEWNKSAPKAPVQSAQKHTAAPASNQAAPVQSAGTSAQNAVAANTVSQSATTVADVSTAPVSKATTAASAAPATKKVRGNKAPANIKAPQMMLKKMAKGMSNKMGGGGASQILALILCIVVGTIGVHRFYLGYIGIGIIQLLTAGGCGIWTLIDLIRIITGDLQPKNGSYTDTL